VKKISIHTLEDFVQTVLEGTLERVTKQGGGETLPDTASTFFGDQGTETTDKTLELGGVDLRIQYEKINDPNLNDDLVPIGTYLHVTLR
jgi:hypothetical protein